MSFDVTILTNKIQKIKESFENGRFGDALVGALNTGNGLMRQRVFIQNTDVKGQSFGQYIGRKKKGLNITAYQQKRQARGRQINKKDLELDGSLRRSPEVQIENEKSVVLQFNTDLAAAIAKGQEQQIENIRQGKPGTTKGSGATRIFTFDESEREEVTEQGKQLIIQILKS